ncbi:MAG: metallophosphoesterase [Gemmatimonadaceae bacterium]
MTFFRRGVAGVAAVIFANALNAQAREISGTVFVDQNGNRAQDAGERGLANVLVSNQDAVALTDNAGAFHLPASPTGIVFVSVPNGYRSTGKFWKTVGDNNAPVSFGLAVAPIASTFQFVHASDTHIAPASVERTRRLRSIVDSIKPSFTIIAGDLVKDALRVGETEARGYYDLFATETGLFKTPVFTVPGNHENFGIETALSHVDPKNPLFGRAMYHHYFGPDYYSFTTNGVHFIGLNTVDIDGTSYYGHVDSVQLAWLARDLEHVPATMPIVTFDHIPFVSSYFQLTGYEPGPPAPSLITVNGKTSYRHTVSNAQEVLTLLRKHKLVLALGAHIHVHERITYEIAGVPTRFETSAAIVATTTLPTMTFTSGLTLYTVRAGVIDSGRFIPLGLSK